MKTEDNLFRMNFIIQDNAAMTLEANLIKIVEEVLYESEKALSLQQISDLIKSNWELDFTDDEIKNAINKKGKNIQTIENAYMLLPTYREKLKRQDVSGEKLRIFVQLAIKELNLDVSEDQLEELLRKYLYYCFNANKNAVLALLDKNKARDVRINESESNIKLINDFLGWDNPEKDRYIYNIVSYGYIYCSLTVKKDNLLSKKLFRGKRFILDANIIFRLAGINNDSRMKTIQSFVGKSREVGVELCYTTDTLEEIQRVITSKVQWIKGVTGRQEALDVREFDYSENDFYKIYYEWSRQKENRHDDFAGFQSYLTNLVIDVLNQIKSVEIPNYELRQSEDFVAYSASLHKYKDEHTKRRQSEASIKTDVNNYMYLRNQRLSANMSSLWTTNDFLISADQNLISWSSTIADSGIPAVVLPSLWLTIMLRFTGRTANDYKTFCSFLELRTHSDEDGIRIYDLLTKLSERTNSNDLKMRIVREVFEHKNDYLELTEDKEDYGLIADKAFDVVCKKDQSLKQAQIDQLENEKMQAKTNAEEAEQKRITEDLFRIKGLADKDCEKHFKVIRFIDSRKMVIGFLLFIVLAVLTILALKKIGPFYLLMKYMNIQMDQGTVLGFLGVLLTLIVALAGFLAMFISYLASDKRVQSYREKRVNYYEQFFQNAAQE